MKKIYKRISAKALKISKKNIAFEKKNLKALAKKQYSKVKILKRLDLQSTIYLYKTEAVIDYGFSMPRKQPHIENYFGSNIELSNEQVLEKATDIINKNYSGVIAIKLVAKYQ